MPLVNQTARGVASISVMSAASLRSPLFSSSELLAEWTGRLRARHAAHRTASAGGGGDAGGAWLDGDAAGALGCDAVVAPVVTGDVDPDAFGDLVRLCVELDRLWHGTGPDGSGGAADGGGEAAGAGRGSAAGAAGRLTRTAGRGKRSSRRSSGRPPRCCPGPAGWRRSCAGSSSAPGWPGPACPWTSGTATPSPAGIRRAVRLRDRHCQWPGGCDQPASACDVHHTTHKADGGTTSLKDCVLLCRFHHLIAIHRWGWTLTVNPDGTTTAWNKDKTRVLHSHSPPARAG